MGKLDWDIDSRSSLDGLSDSMRHFGDNPVVVFLYCLITLSSMQLKRKGEG